MDVLPADAFCRIIFRYDGVSCRRRPGGAGNGACKRGSPGGKRISLFSLLLYATSLLQWEKDPARSLLSRATPFTMQESSKMIKRRTRKRNVHPGLLSGQCQWGHGLRRRLRYSPDSGPLLRLGKRNPFPLVWEKEGKGHWRSWCSAGRRRIFCVRPSLKTLRKPFGPKALRTLKGYIMAVSRRSRHLLRKVQNESGGFSMRKLIAVTYDTEFKAEEVRLQFLKMQKSYLASLEDAVVVEKAEW